MGFDIEFDIIRYEICFKYQFFYAYLGADMSCLEGSHYLFLLVTDIIVYTLLLWASHSGILLSRP